jgi:hypothetical protein
LKGESVSICHLTLFSWEFESNGGSNENKKCPMANEK